MDPVEISAHLRAMADYVDGHPQPSREIIASHLGRIVAEMSKTAGKVTKFVDKDIAAASSGLDSLIAALTKAAQTLNPQDQAKGELEAAVQKFQGLKAGLMQTVQGIQNVEV